MKIYKKIVFFISCILILSGISGCSNSNVKLDKSSENKKIKISFYGNLDESYLPFLNSMAEQIPQAQLCYEYQWDIAVDAEPERRIANGDGPDLFIINGNYLSSMAEKDMLLNLTDTDFSTRYHVSAMTLANKTGNVYGLPLPNDLRCLICNKDILKKYGITELPKSTSELIEICKKLNSEGQGSIIFDIELYYMLLRANYLCKPDGFEWISDYNKGNGTMKGTPVEKYWETLEEISKYSGCSQKDSFASPSRKTTLMSEGKYAFRASTLSNLKFTLGESDMDLVAIPLLGETEQDQWVYYANSQTMRYFAANAELDKPENAEKKEIVLKLLDWISTEDTQQLLAKCGSSAISYVNNVELEQDEIMKYLDPVIKQGHLTNSPNLERNLKDTILDCAVKILIGELTPQQAVEICDEQNRNYKLEKDAFDSDKVIGYCKENIYWRKPEAVTIGSPMTQLAAIAMSDSFSQADFSFAMARNTLSSLYEGDVTIRDILACFIGEQDSELVLVKASGKQIKDVIDAGVGSAIEPNYIAPYGISGAGRLIHPVGLSYKADVRKGKGNKITEIILNDGNTLDLDKMYTVIVSKLMVDVVLEPNFKDCEVISTGKYLKDIMFDYVTSHEELISPEVNFEIFGANILYEVS